MSAKRSEAANCASAANSLERSDRGRAVIYCAYDLVVKSDGFIWFTDPPFGIQPNYEGHMAAPELGQNVYRVDPDRGDATIVADDILGPNGLVVSPDEAVLYIAESRGGPTRKILSCDISPEGTAIRG